jgi:DnaJ-class molecular chaperone
MAVATEASARLFEPPDGDSVRRPSLEDSILGVWEELTLEGVAECPVCHGPMRAAAVCESCGSDLA